MNGPSGAEIAVDVAGTAWAVVLVVAAVLDWIGAPWAVAPRLMLGATVVFAVALLGLLAAHRWRARPGRRQTA